MPLSDYDLEDDEIHRSCQVPAPQNNFGTPGQLVIPGNEIYGYKALTGNFALIERRWLLPFSENLLAFYHKCCSLIGYATRYLFRDSIS